MFEARRLRFHVDGINGGRFSGWVYRRDHPTQRLSVMVTSRAGHLVQHAADLYRADVHRADAGSDGYCGFAIPVRALADDIVVACKSPHRLLFRGSRAQSIAPAPQIAVRGDRLFCIDSGRQLSGWLSSTGEPDMRLGIVLRVDGRIVSSQTACLYRHDRPVDGSDGLHGFAFAYPAEGQRAELIDSANGDCLHRFHVKA